MADADNTNAAGGEGQQAPAAEYIKLKVVGQVCHFWNFLD
jgi:hypothetical protein